MEKTRVPFREWYSFLKLSLNSIDFEIVSTPEIHCEKDDARFNSGNYFHTEKEAELMASKLRAVLKGAEVEDEKFYLEKFIEYLTHKKYQVFAEVGRLDSHRLKLLQSMIDELSSQGENKDW